jgi:hypothetical protein
LQRPNSRRPQFDDGDILIERIENQLSSLGINFPSIGLRPDEVSDFGIGVNVVRIDPIFGTEEPVYRVAGRIRFEVDVTDFHDTVGVLSYQWA